MDAPDLLLDLFSTSQTFQEKCINHAPFLCIPQDGDRPGYFAQGCCNDWLCPRCGRLRAKHEYGRMVVGARELAKDHQLWFITLTCPGDIGLEDAERSYLENTNRLLTAWRTHATRKKIAWHYAAVTERQRRGHPHSHLLTSFAPADKFCSFDEYQRYVEDVNTINSEIPENMRFSAQDRQDLTFLDYHSSYLMLSSVKAGLGVQCRISIVDSPEAASRYIAKYLFKESAREIWPKGWKRVRYSQNWPKLPEKHNPAAFIVLSAWDWHLVADSGHIVTKDYNAYENAIRHGALNIVYNPPPRD